MVHSLNHFFGGNDLIFLGRSFGEIFFVVLRSLGLNLVILGSHLTEFWIFLSSLTRCFPLFSR
jgi:hypothetical protein